jgi:hypothetical protein
MSAITAILRDAHLFIGSINIAQRVADFAYGGVDADAVDDERHGVGIADAAVRTDFGLLGGGALQGIERAADFVIVAA